MESEGKASFHEHLRMEHVNLRDPSILVVEKGKVYVIYNHIAIKKFLPLSNPPSVLYYKQFGRGLNKYLEAYFQFLKWVAQLQKTEEPQGPMFV